MVKEIILFIQIFLILGCSSNQLVIFNSAELSGIKIQSDRIILKVIDLDTSEPLIGANISFSNSDIEIAPTNIDGLTFIPEGGLGNIKISYIGYKSCSFEIKSSSLDNILVKMNGEEFIGGEYAFFKNKNDAKRDLSNGIIQIYRDINDSTEEIAKNLANKYGFNFNYPDVVVMLLDVEEYNNEVIKYLEKRNGKNWYERFNNELNARIKESIIN